MTKLTATLVLLFATFFSSVEGLAFVTGIMRPIVTPVAAMRQRAATAPAITTSLSTAANADEVSGPTAATKVDVAKKGVFGSDDSTRAYRSEMLDLVYQRSLDRMDSFAQ